MVNAEERAQQYAALFTAIGDRWRLCVPIDGQAHRFEDEMTLDGVRIIRPDGAPVWGLA